MFVVVNLKELFHEDSPPQPESPPPSTAPALADPAAAGRASQSSAQVDGICVVRPMTPPLDLSRFVSRLATLGIDAQLVAWSMVDTGGRKSIYELAKFFDDRENREQIHRTATALKARAARGQASNDDLTRRHYGAFELPSFPLRTVKVITGGKCDATPAPHYVVSLPETGHLDIEQLSDGSWRVHHVGWWDDHAAIVANGLPSRLEALQSLFSYALGCIHHKLTRQSDGDGRPAA